MNVKLEDDTPTTTVTSAPSRDTSSGSRKTSSKRTRTKHACDECRRTQKKCDGVKPVCRRCRLNDSPCTYTPHKVRRTCACVGLHDLRRHRPLPGVCIGANDYCTKMSSTDALSVQMGYLGRMHPARSTFESFRTPIVPSQHREWGVVRTHLPYKEPSLSGSGSSSPYPVIIPHQTDAQYSPGLSSTFAIAPPFTPPVNASPARRNSVALPFTHSDFSGPTYHPDNASVAPSLQVSIPSYEGSLHLSSGESPESSPFTPYSVIESATQDASHSLGLAKGIANPQPFPEASYQLSSSGAYAYQHLPESPFINLSHSQSMDEELLGEQHIQQFGFRPEYMKEHLQPQLPPPAFADEYLRESPSSHHSSPITHSDQFPSYPLSASQESWAIGYSTSSPLRRHSAPCLSAGSEFSGLVAHEQLAYQSYAEHY